MAARKTPGGGKGQDKVWSEAIRLAAFEQAEKGGPKKIRRAAEKLVELALDGDMGALKEMGDRLEGKPAQAVELDGALEISRIERRIVNASDTDS